MKHASATRSLALGVLAALLFAGCGTTTTTVRLTGTPGTQVSGHYRATHCDSDFAGEAGWQMDFNSQELLEFEFRKASVNESVAVEIFQGRDVVVQATAEPGTTGLRVRHGDDWRVESVK